jgi:hypothetical protein
MSVSRVNNHHTGNFGGMCSLLEPMWSNWGYYTHWYAYEGKGQYETRTQCVRAAILVDIVCGGMT